MSRHLTKVHGPRAFSVTGAVDLEAAFLALVLLGWSYEGGQHRPVRGETL
jgi:hypothetical protein